MVIDPGVWEVWKEKLVGADDHDSDEKMERARESKDI